jgi:hypothetical protein
MIKTKSKINFYALDVNFTPEKIILQVFSDKEGKLSDFLPTKTELSL